MNAIMLRCDNGLNSTLNGETVSSLCEWFIGNKVLLNVKEEGN